jgi:hypothetical protein
MDSGTCVVTNNRRMPQNNAALYLLISSTLYFAYVMVNGQIGSNILNDTIRTLRTLNIKHLV